VRVKAPYIAVPRGARKVAARAARDLVSMIEGFAERYNELHATELTPAQGLITLLDSNVSPRSLFSDFRHVAEQSRGALSAWTVEKNFDQGYKWLTPEFGDWFVQVIVPRPCKIDDFHEFEGAPWLTKVILEHARGKQWMREFVQELMRFLYPDAPRGDIELR